MWYGIKETVIVVGCSLAVTALMVVVLTIAAVAWEWVESI